MDTRFAFADALREIAKCAGDDFIDDRIILRVLAQRFEKCCHDFTGCHFSKNRSD